MKSFQRCNVCEILGSGGRAAARSDLIRDMMVQAVESRFGAGTRKLPTPIYHLA